ncbi:MAG: UTP--glucose-1-phosphate uridylyltransferase [Clostridiales bacterium]|jgi:UTP--glucose-1-phosphate uridylyltransferase|nr:UTP--glucose-1-phosphate uridylyltransferase [Clostridiales bacterium]
MDKLTVRKAVIPAAGFGTRFLPITKSVPKEMLPIVDKPAVQYIVEEAVDSGIKEILIIANRFKRCIEDHFDKNYELENLLKRFDRTDDLKTVLMSHLDAEFTYVRQKEMRGSGAAVGLARSFVKDEPFAVLFADDVIYNANKPCTRQLIEAYEKTRLSVVGVQSVSDKTALKCGVIKKGAVKGRYTEIKGIVEKPSDINALPSNLASLGRFVLTPDIFDALERTALRNNEVFLTDAIDLVAREAGAYAYEFEGERYDIGDRVGFLIANIEYGLRDKRAGGELKKYLSELNRGGGDN